MRLGVSLASSHAVSDPREGARRMIDRARAAGAAGLDSLFVGDHHATPTPYYQNSAILGRLLAEWDAPVFGALYLLPLWHPLLVAEQVATLASIGSGRFVLQCAIGPHDPQFPAFGVDPRHRPSRFEEGLELIRRLCAGETVSSDGRYALQDASMSPLPPDGLEVWIGAAAEPAIDRAARLGDGWLAAPALTPSGARKQLELYRERCAAHGREPGACVLRRDVYVGEDEAEAEAVAGPLRDGGHRGFPPEALVIGSVERATETLREFAAMGYDEVLVRNLVRDPERAVACIERLGEVRQGLAR